MASSSSYTTLERKYTVFLNFRGEDTRRNFTCHLYEALRKENIATFIDDELIRGDEISQSLFNTIKQSKISVAIFSEQYASSRWCLEELVMILESKRKYGQIVIPVFYHVNPSDVRKQTGTFGDKFSQRFKDYSEMLHRWSTALKEAGNISGFDSSNYRLESSLVKAIVKDILKKLEDDYLEIDNKKLVGKRKENIATFIDDELIRGDEISQSLSNAIEQSKTSVVIFSEQHASSRRCVKELEKIHEMMGQIEIPVFYHVDPSDVRHRTGTFGEGFSQLEDRFKDNLEMLKRWRTALTNAANLSCLVSNIYRHESSLVNAIVEDGLKKLNDEYLVIDNKKLVGLKHKVFLSFRREHTRTNFTSHLYEALRKENIATFIDDNLNRGDEISQSLLNAIELSKISVVIFSEQYASSRWCLTELEKILECNCQIVIPVFYHVVPSDVRNQTGTFGKGFSQLEERFKDDLEMLQRWRTALTNAANLSGFDSNNYRHESSLLNDIVEFILKKLEDEYLVIDNKKLVGLESTIQCVEILLSTAGVRRLGIWGIGGIGKTTFAAVLFRKISKQFEISCFIGNIREESEKSGGLNDLRQRVSSKLIGDIYPNTGFTLKRKKVGRALIVFDDVTELSQMEYLMEDYNLDPESLIIITARDEHVLKECGVDPTHILEMLELAGDDAFQLFNQYAFGEHGPTEDYFELSSRFVEYAKGLPLALKVLGSYLIGRTKAEWESALHILKIFPHLDIYKVLKVSYNGLDDDEKQVFLDIACFFNGCETNLIEDVLDSCSFASIINALIEKSLITTSSNTIIVHDLLQDMGKEIVRQESPNNPGKSSRLWDHEEIRSILKNKRGTGAIRSLSLDISKVREIHLHPEAFNKMHNLKFLEVYGLTDGNEKLHGFEDLTTDFSELRYLCWYNYYAESLPPNFDPENIVALFMTYSKIKRLWTGDKNLNNLKHIDLSHSQDLLCIPNLSSSPNLESLILKGCTNLLEDFSSIGHLNKLVHLNLRECKGFESLPINTRWTSLRTLILSKCSNLKTVPYIPNTVEELYLDGTAIKKLPSLKHISGLKILSLENCSKLEHLPDSIGESDFLRIVILSNCSKIKTVPYIPSRVEELYLDGTAIEELPLLEHLFTLVKLSLKNCLRLQSLPESISEIKSLKYLYLSGSSKLDRLPDGLKDLKALEKLEAEGIGVTDIPSLTLTYLNNLKKLSFVRCGIRKPPVSLLSQLPACHKLEQLNLEDCCIEVLPKNLGELHSLEFLNLGGNNFWSLPESIKELSKLCELDLSNCQRLKSLPQLPDKLLRIEAKGCVSLEAISGLPNQCLCMRTPNEEIRFLNCCNLKLDLTDALLNIERNADLWFSSEENTISLSRANLKAYGLPEAYSLPEACSLPKASICYPGSEIPDWFTFTSQTGYIELPSYWLNDDLIGFSFCAVASFRDYEEAGDLQVRCFLVVDEKIVSTGCLFNDNGDEVVQSDDVIESDHVFLGYDYDLIALELLTTSLNSKGYMEFFVVHGSKNSKKKSKVKKCGVRLLYAKENYMRADARVDRDLRFPYRDGCFRCCLHCCAEHDAMDENKSFETLDRWSPHSEIYKPPIRRDYSAYIRRKKYAQHLIRKRTD